MKTPHTATCRMHLNQWLVGNLYLHIPILKKKRKASNNLTFPLKAFEKEGQTRTKVNRGRK